MALMFLMSLQMFSNQSADANQSSKYVVGQACSPEFDAAKPKTLYCYVEKTGLFEDKLKNSSGFDLPAGTPVTIIETGNGKEFRVADIALDRKISGVTKSSIPRNKFGKVFIGDGDTKCVDSFASDPQKSVRCNWIDNFDTRSYKKGQILYLGDKGTITTKRQGKIVTVGLVEAVMRSAPEVYTLNIGRVPNIEILTWQRYLTQGENCAYLSEEQISPDLVCVEGDYVLVPKNPGKSVGETVYEKTGLSLDSTAWFPAIVLILLVILLFTIADSSKGFGSRVFETLFNLLRLLLVCVGLVALFINVIQPLFSNNTVDFSRKVLGIPTYFYFLPIMLSLVLRINKKL
jgi:hypothetical protein